MFTVTASQTADLVIPHQDVEISVSGQMDNNVETKKGIRLYLFSPSGSYLGIYKESDAGGKATFHLPKMEYKVRADYLNQQFWSASFTAQDTSVVIKEGMAEITVTNIGAGLPGIKVYAFSDSGSECVLMLSGAMQTLTHICSFMHSPYLIRT